MDITPFKGFITSLSLLTGLQFEIWNGSGFAFSSGAEGARMPNPEQIQDLRDRILQNQGFQNTLSEDGCVAFGVPIQNGEPASATLIALGHGQQTPWAAVGSTTPPRAYFKEMDVFLTYLAGLIEDKWKTQKEVEEMADELARNFSDLYLYSRIATQLRTLKFSGDMLKNLIEDLLDTMRVDLSFAQLRDRKEYDVLACKPEIAQKIPDHRVFIESLIQAIPPDASSLEEHYFAISDSKTTPGFAALHTDPFRFLAVKLKHNKAFYGWLGMVSFNLKEIFRRSELSLMGMMAEQIAVVIANTDLYRDLERFVINVVKSLVQAIEAKDGYTRGHSERVNLYCMAMASELNMADQQKNVLHWASILHDIGKIGIPEAILNKPGRLTPEEYDVIKSHPSKGMEILRPIEQMHGSLPGILHHHERLDGKGYPQGLKGEEISLIGRVIAVADTFDAITSSRAYRSAKPAQEALAIIDEVAGTQLDPALVRAFKAALDKHPKCSVKEGG